MVRTLALTGSAAAKSKDARIAAATWAGHSTSEAHASSIAIWRWANALSKALAKFSWLRIYARAAIH